MISMGSVQGSIFQGEHTRASEPKKPDEDLFKGRLS